MGAPIDTPEPSVTPTKSQRHALVIGASSSLGVALCRELASRGWDVCITGRDEENIASLAEDIRLRTGNRSQVDYKQFDLLNKKSCKSLIADCSNYTDIFMLAGEMANNERDDPAIIEHVIAVNYAAPSQLLAQISSILSTQDSPRSITVVSSVAGDRGRQSNYVYGSAKAAMTAFTDGLRNRYSRTSLHIMTVKPGFMDTPLTFGMDSPLMASREKVAMTIINALLKKRNIVYVPWFWQEIMLVIKSIPECIFKRLSL